ncbi:MAG: alpha-glucan family phosphorylase [Gemmatimonadaceae bacterium]
MLINRQLLPDLPDLPDFPARLDSLAAIATNLSWSWSRDGRRMFQLIDAPLWEHTGHDPIMLLRQTDPARLVVCARDPLFLQLYGREVDRLARESGVDTGWFAKKYPDLTSRPVAYFCAEFAVHSSIPIYSGGLGVLAGDQCKSASDLGVPFVGVGLLYTGGYFDQRIRPDGWQEESDESIVPGDTALELMTTVDGDRSIAVVRMFGRDVRVGAYRLAVGRTMIYLLTTDLEQNHADDRGVTRKLYAGGPDLRLRQEWILGVGGVRVLRALGIEPAAWHANEGHAAFMMVERLRELMAGGTPNADAVREVRARGIFTTHTPVAAGHDAFAAEDVAQCAGPIWEEMRISKEALLAVGHLPSTQDGSFDMTAAAIRLSGRVNGVAERHGEVSRAMSQPFWPDRPVQDVPIGYVTNGVHLATWMSDELMTLLDGDLGLDWEARREDPNIWQQLLSLDDAALWGTHQTLKRALLDALRERERRRWTESGSEAESAEHAVLRSASDGLLLDPAVLTIGFARRFATYKRADLIFHDLNRLRALLTDVRRPVQLVFAGKAHPADAPGKQILQRVYEFTQDPSLAGRVVFVEDYDMRSAAQLVQGVDLWLNLPRVPFEASGTSGMKAALNGVPQLSTMDGWWPEAYNGLNGWAIPLAAPTLDDEAVDAVDAEHLYTLLEREVVPLFYTRDDTGLPTEWIRRMKHAICVAGQKFTARRMVEQYAKNYYAPTMRAESFADDPPTG